MTDSTKTTGANGQGPQADPLAPLYDPPALNDDPGVHVPDVPADVPIHQLSAADAPSQSRPADWDEKGRPRLRYLSRREYDILTKLTETLIAPPDGVYPIPPAKAAMNVDRYLAASRSPMRLQIKVALHVLNLWTLKSFRPPFRWMSLAARRKWAKRFERNKGSMVTKLMRLKNLVYMNYYSDPDVDAFTGYNVLFDRDPEAAPLRRHIRERLRAGQSTTG